MRCKILILFFFIILLSCERDETIYSCDPDINAIVKSGFSEFSELTLSEFLEYDIILQKAIFRSFTDEKKRDFWLEKLDSVLILNDFSYNEELHINNLIKEIVPGYFNIEELDSTDYKRRLQYSIDWYDYASDSLGWTDSKTNYIRFSLYLTEEQYLISKDELMENWVNTLQRDCNCTSEVDECDGDIGSYCEDASCQETSMGCGFLWLSPCTGLCN